MERIALTATRDTMLHETPNEPSTTELDLVADDACDSLPSNLACKYGCVHNPSYGIYDKDDETFASALKGGRGAYSVRYEGRHVEAVLRLVSAREVMNVYVEGLPRTAAEIVDSLWRNYNHHRDPMLFIQQLTCGGVLTTRQGVTQTTLLRAMGDLDRAEFGDLKWGRCASVQEAMKNLVDLTMLLPWSTEIPKTKVVVVADPQQDMRWRALKLVATALERAEVEDAGPDAAHFVKQSLTPRYRLYGNVSVYMGENLSWEALRAMYKQRVEALQSHLNAAAQITITMELSKKDHIVKCVVGAVPRVEKYLLRLRHCIEHQINTNEHIFTAEVARHVSDLAVYYPFTPQE